MLQLLRLLQSNRARLCLCRQASNLQKPKLDMANIKGGLLGPYPACRVQNFRLKAALLAYPQS